MNTLTVVLIIIGAILVLLGCLVIFLVVNINDTDWEKSQEEIDFGWKSDEEDSLI